MSAPREACGTPPSWRSSSASGYAPGEIVKLTLDDIDWRAGEIAVRGKGQRADLLPLPADVGQALATYLEKRMADAHCRTVFVNVVAPRRAITPTGVNAVVRRACWRAGIAQTGTHRFRHGVATELLGAGASLPEIGQLLRHHHLQTTALYAKVDFDALASVAQPWPGARPSARSVKCSTSTSHCGERWASSSSMPATACLALLPFSTPGASGASASPPRVEWAAQQSSPPRVLTEVRVFARYAQALDPANEVPPVELCPQPTPADPLPLLRRGGGGPDRRCPFTRARGLGGHL